MRYQIAQKVHAVSDPHDPPAYENDRARDVVDLLLLRDLTRATGTPDIAELKTAILDIFAARAHDAAALGYPERTWPAKLTAYPHWGASFTRAAQSAGADLDVADAVAQVNDWMDEIDAAPNSSSI
jgi:hypothetical protein